jgi:hypothetical protein
MDAHWFSVKFSPLTLCCCPPSEISALGLPPVYQIRIPLCAPLEAALQIPMIQPVFPVSGMNWHISVNVVLMVIVVRVAPSDVALNCSDIIES